MFDVAVYSAIAAIIATIAGAVSAAVNSMLNAKVQRKSLEIQEKATEYGASASSMSTATQLASTSGQTTVQLYNLLQDCIRSREEQIASVHTITRNFATLSLKVVTAIHNIKDLIEEHECAYKKQGLECDFYDELQKRLMEILRDLGEPNV
jgi:hypothetical protein